MNETHEVVSHYVKLEDPTRESWAPEDVQDLVTEMDDAIDHGCELGVAGAEMIHFLNTIAPDIPLPTHQVASLLNLDGESLHEKYGCTMCAHSAVEEALFGPTGDHVMVDVATEYADFLAEGER